MKKYLLVFLCVVLMLQGISVKAESKTKVSISSTSYNEQTGTWDFTIQSNSNKKIYYTYSNEHLDKKCKYVYDGDKISVQASLINTTYTTLKLFIFEKDKMIKMYYRINNIANNVYAKDLLSLCYDIVDTNDSDYIKAKKLYTWIGENKLYKFEGNKNNVYNALYGKYCACSGFARLYVDMCKLVGLKAEYASEYIVDYKYTEWHAWVHLYLDGNIYLVDPTWSGVCFNNEVNYSHFCNNSVVNYVVTEKYDLSSKNIYEQ
ncbi:transglutaminase-like domain-containing protein [Anaerosporobacter faecicola]|uniref:transglutaminase-like domain-containing protein n=1 Tax=Anaerosporobacter faecicola TaxID=2718714 RepID=UPI0014398610|nr:transglutaminase-like domain-containing protein [Anaerosporobacter faecicola]